MQRRESGHAEERMLKVELPVRRKTGKPQRRFMDTEQEDMQRFAVTDGGT